MRTISIRFCFCFSASSFKALTIAERSAVLVFFEFVLEVFFFESVLSDDFSYIAAVSSKAVAVLLLADVSFLAAGAAEAATVETTFEIEFKLIL